MSKKANLEFANLICKFGPDLNLIDLASEVILPGLIRGDRVREYGDTRYFFHDPQILRVGAQRDPVLLIAARFIKDTKLRREQYFDEGRGLVQDESVLDSAPSAIFVLILNSHKLLYFPETPHAPTLGNLESTLHRFIRDAHFEYINDLFVERMATYEGNPETIPRPTKTALRQEFPPPKTRLIPIGGEAQLRAFIDKFQSLRSAEVTLVETNSEIDNDEFFAAMRKSGDDAGASKTTLTQRNPEGLSKDGVYDQVEAAVKQANSHIKLAGKDAAGGDLRGSNDEFRVRTPIEDVSGLVREASKQLHAKYSETVHAGTIPAAEIAAVVQEKIRNLYLQHQAEADA